MKRATFHVHESLDEDGIWIDRIPPGKQCDPKAVECYGSFRNFTDCKTSALTTLRKRRDEIRDNMLNIKERTAKDY